MSEQYPEARLKLSNLVKINFKLRASGLLIMSGKTKEVLGAADIQPMSIQRVYRFNNAEYILTVPYIPASSLKGRARSLLETALDLPLHTTDGKIYLHMRIVQKDVAHKDPFCPVDNVFGTPSIAYRELKEEYRYLFDCWAPSRAIFRDLFPSKEYVKSLCDAKGDCAYVSLEDFLEEKNENRIDRVTSTADPREILRLRPGVEFDGSITVLVYDIDLKPKEDCVKYTKIEEIKRGTPPVKYYLDMLIKSLRLVEETYLGASGTRGYGQVEFTNLEAKLLDALTLSELRRAEAPSLAMLGEKVSQWWQ